MSGFVHPSLRRGPPRDILGRVVHPGFIPLGAALMGHELVGPLKRVGGASPTELLKARGNEWAHLVTVDFDGVIWFLRAESRKNLYRQCQHDFVLCHPSLGTLVESIKAGRCYELVPEYARAFMYPWQGLSSLDR